MIKDNRNGCKDINLSDILIDVGVLIENEMKIQLVRDLPKGKAMTMTYNIIIFTAV